jgi:hypothetical protein
VYQYILKLRQEIPEALRPVPLESPADLQLQQISRDTVYKHVRKHAADSRPKAKEAAPHTASPSDASAPSRPSAPSPLSDHVRTLMFGKEESAEETTPPAPSPEQKKTKPPASLTPFSEPTPCSAC